jgi:hypothetical protein
MKNANKCIVTEIRSMVVLGQLMWRHRVKDYKRICRNFSVLMDVFNRLIVVMFTQVSANVKTYQII